MATLTDDDTPRIMCLACGRPRNGKLRIVTGGFELKVWKEVESSKISR